MASCLVLCGVACNDKTTSKPSDAGAPLPRPIACGSGTCAVTAGDVKWGGQACCLDPKAAACGVKSDNPTITDANGNPIALTDVLVSLMDADGGAFIVNTHPKIPCLPKSTPGTKTAKCPAQSFDGMSTSSSSDDAGAGSLQVDGCCGPDGMCGFLDNITGFGCVKVSQSVIGQALGLHDKSCD
jgi:hypothetical protein